MTDAVVVYCGCQFYSSVTMYLVLTESCNYGEKFCPSIKHQLIHTLLYCTIYRCIMIQNWQYLDTPKLQFGCVKILPFLYHNTHVYRYTIDNTHPYGYETNHVSPLISMQSRWFYPSFALQKNISWFVVLRDDERLLVRQIVYTCGFMNYLLDEATYCK